MTDAKKMGEELAKTGEFVLVIMRGVPGSGKSSFAHDLQQSFHLTGGLSSAICSADQFFIRPDGTYDWNPKLLKNAHEWCFSRVKSAMSSEITVGEHGWPEGCCSLIILDNTNIVKAHYRKYVDLAKENGYSVREVVIGKFDEESLKEYCKRNVHSVSLDTIKAMAGKFES